MADFSDFNKEPNRINWKLIDEDATCPRCFNSAKSFWVVEDNSSSYIIACYTDESHITKVILNYE